MIRLLQETLSRLVFEEYSAMAQKGKDGTEMQYLKGVKEEPSLSETVAELKSQIVLQEKEMFDIRKVNKRLEKRNKNLKDSIEKLIEEKRQIEELSKVIEDQKEKIEQYEKEINEMKERQKVLEEKPVPEKKQTSPIANNKSKTADPQLLQKQIELLSSKNLELKAELDRRTRISDQTKREHEAALKDRNELISEVKTLKQQVDDMRHRLDRSLALLVKKRKGIKETEGITIESPSSTISESITLSAKGTQTLREKPPTKIPMPFQNRRPGGGRLILNSVGRAFQTVASKKSRGLLSQKVDKKTPAEVSPKSKEESSKLHKETIEKEKPVAISQSIQEVQGKRVVSDIRNKLEKMEMNKEYVLNMDESRRSTDSQNGTLDAQPISNQRITEDIMDFFEVIDEDDSSTRKV